MITASVGNDLPYFTDRDGNTIWYYDPGPGNVADVFKLLSTGNFIVSFSEQNGDSAIREIDLQRVAPVQRHVRRAPDRVLQRRAQPLVELDDVHVRDARGEVLREHPQTTADLEHDVRGRELREAADDAEHVRVDEKVLPELAVRTDRELAHPPHRRLGHHPKTRAAVRSITPPSSTTDTPRSSARNSAVCVTNAG